jgi:hypothetical protein
MEVRTAAATAQAVRAPALPRPASQQHHQAALVSPNKRICSSISKHAHLVSRRLRCRAGVSTSCGRAFALVPGLPHLDLAATEKRCGLGSERGGFERVVCVER